MAPIRVPLSFVDRSRTRDGEAPGRALRDSVERAVRAEEMGYTRIGLAEHHGVPGIATGAPAVLMAAVAAATGRIRVGSAGVMIPNHRPLIVAEQARALQALFPGRIDLGIGRSLGFTAPVRAALGATEYDLDDMERDLRALRDFFDDAGPVRAMPTGEPVPMFVLATGSGLAVAARRGLPVIVGGPILRGDLAPLEDYRRDFVPSAEHPEPAVLISVDVTVGPTADRARDWLLPEAWAMVASRTVGAFPPLEDVTPDSLAAKGLTDRQERWVRRHLDNAVWGTAGEVADELNDLVVRTGASEVLAYSSTYDRAAQTWSDEALAGLIA
jgi:luciferase family oxidoreductase group 1